MIDPEVESRLKRIEGKLRALRQPTQHTLDLKGPGYISSQVTLQGPGIVWDDIRVSGESVKVGATAPAYTAFGPTGDQYAWFFETAHHDEVHFSVQMPHTWKEGSYIYPHIHWGTTGTTDGSVNWQLEYSWANKGSAFPESVHMETGVLSLGTTAWVHKTDPFVAGGVTYIDGVGKTISSMILFKLHRDAGAQAIPAAFLEFDIHYQLDSWGSMSASSK